MKPVIVVHGGAWSVPDNIAEGTLLAVKRAAKVGHSLLSNGKSCVDAVVEAVSILEDNELLNAGKGSDFNIKGENEMHAMVMSGESLDAGGAVSVKNVKNPVKAAKLIMEKSEHCVLQGSAVSALAEKHGLELMPDDYFVTEAKRKELQTYLDFGTAKNELINVDRKHDTVGAVARDKYGNLACATSTGGITGQMKGRVSDSPLPGCGGFADNNSAAVSTTGHGESLIRTCMAKLIASHVENGASPQASAVKSLQYMRTKVKGQGGAIVVDVKGRVGIHCTTERMSWAVIGADLESEEPCQDNAERPRIIFSIDPGVVKTENL